MGVVAARSGRRDVYLPRPNRSCAYCARGHHRSVLVPRRYRKVTDIRLHQEGSSVYAERVDWTDPVFQQIAAQYSDILGCDVRVLADDDTSSAGYSGFRVKTAGGYHADVYAMLVNWRLALVPEGQECPVPKRYWCFAGRDGISLLL